MALRTPLILNQTSGRIEELAAGDGLFGSYIDGYVGKNYVINGDFRYWQRATSQALRDTGYAPLYLAADRWYMASAGTQVGISRQDFSPGQTEVPGNPRYYMRVGANSGLTAASLGYFGQTFEGAGTFAGVPIAISFYARGNVAAKLGSSFVQSFGSGGSTDVNIIGPTLNITTSWQKYTIAIAPPSISGKIFGSGGNDHFRMRLWLDAGSNYSNSIVGNVGNQTWSLDIANVQIELGSAATSFEYRPDALELALCQRYYEKSYNLDVMPGAVNNTKGITQFQLHGQTSIARTISLNFPFRVTKRAEPAFTTYSYSTGAAGRVRDAASGVDVTPGNSNIGTGGGSVDVTLTASSVVNVVAHWTADSEL